MHNVADSPHIGYDARSVTEPWWAQRQLGPCQHAYRIHQLFLEDFGWQDGTILRYHACIICGERGFLELPKEKPPDAFEPPYHPNCRSTVSNAPPGWAQEQERNARTMYERMDAFAAGDSIDEDLAKRMGESLRKQQERFVYDLFAKENAKRR